MRMLSTWEQLVATADDTGVQVHQYANAHLRTSDVELAVETGYPWDGTVVVEVVRTPDRPWALSLRVPGWCHGATLHTGPAGDAGAGATRDRRQIDTSPRTLRETRTWRAGDTIALTLYTPPRITEPDPRVDAVRGCVALERGPLVYCVESTDQAEGADLVDVVADASGDLAERPADETLGDAVAVAAGDLTFIPYHLWGNRGLSTMRVWVPGR
jgi:DUF1680 family protein